MLRLELNKDDMTQNDIDTLGDIFGHEDVNELLRETDDIILQLEAK